MSLSKIKAKGKTIDLNQQTYRAAGGEGEVHVSGGFAYKIYHDPKKMIPVEKIQELAVLDKPEILAPLYPITDIKDNPVGFAMRAVDKTEFLCKLFTRGFRDSNGIDPSTINGLVKGMQDTFKHIHKHNTLVVDANELNFLVNQKFDKAFFIDVDCYQTPHYPATAIMESIRDPKVVNNQFTVMSDWFSAAIVFFQLYMGTHPYKGRHPDHGKDWQEMQKNHVSVFNKATRMPPNVQDWSVIPKGHLKWFEKVFEHGERIAPPEPDQITVTAGQVVPQIVSSTAKFDLKQVSTYDGDIEAIRWIGGVEYVYTTKAIYVNKRLLTSFAPSGFTARYASHDFCYVQNDQPVKLTYDRINEVITWEKLDGKQSDKIAASSYFVAHDRLYVVNNGKLVEYSFMNLGAKVIAPQQVVGGVFHTHTAFDGVVIQDILGTARFLIPSKAGEARLISVPCLNRNRIIDAKYARGTAVVLAEQEGEICRWTFSFDKEIKDFTVRCEKGVAIEDLRLTVLDKGVAVSSNDDKLEVFVDSTKVRVIDDSPLTGNQKLASFGNEIYVVNKNELFKLSMK